jgi:hypothetical protein
LNKYVHRFVKPLCTSCVPEEAKCVTHGSKYSGNTLQLHEELAHLEQDVSNKTIVGEIIDGGFSHPLVATYS